MKPGETIGQLAEKKGINLRQLAIKADIPYNTLYAIVKRKSERIDLTTLQRIAAALDVDPYSLYSFDQATEALEQRINVQDARGRVAATMEQLSPEGQVKVADYAEDILPRYQTQERPQPPAEPQESRDTTPSQEGSEGPPEGK